MYVHMPSSDGGAGTQGGSFNAWDLLRQVTR